MTRLGTAQIVRGNALSLPLADQSIDLIVTSPPYFALRSYQDDGEHYDGQIGSEETPQAFLEALWAAMAECWRVLKPSGSCWVNLGDKYAGSGGHNNSGVSGGPSQLRDAAYIDRLHDQAKATRRDAPNRYNQVADVRAKSLMGLPWSFANGCIGAYPFAAGLAAPDSQRWILRAEVVWDKPNGLPESVTDRVRRSHEQWFHFTKEGRYFAAVDEVREPQNGNSHGTRHQRTGQSGNGQTHRSLWTHPGDFNPLGKLPGSVWSIPSEPLIVPDHIDVDHFAAFPTEWPRRIILGWSPSGICVACDEGRRPVIGVDWAKVPHRMVEKRVLTDKQKTEWVHEFRKWCESRAIQARDLDEAANTKDMGGHWLSRPSQHEVPTPAQWALLEAAFGPMPSALSKVVHSTRLVPVTLVEYGVGDKAHSGRHRNDFAKTMSDGEFRSITGYACACDEPTADTRPAVVLDPFGGTGTVAMVAKALGRTGISVDMSADYCRLAEWRVNDADQIRKVQANTYGISRQGPKVSEGQESLFGVDVA